MSEGNCVARRAVTRHEGNKLHESAKAHEVADANESAARRLEEAAEPQVTG
jgi:hypothetical protein